MIGAVVLAAGASSRLGRPKPLLSLQGGTLLALGVRPLLDAGLDRVVVVLGCRADEVWSAAGLPEDPRLRVAVNADWARGMASSLRRGLVELASADAVLVALADQPGVATSVVRGLVEAFRAGAPLALPVHAARAGHPVLFARSLFPELLALAGDVGARSVVERHLSQAARVPAGPCFDIDSDEDYRAYLAGTLPPSGRVLS